MDNNEYNKKLDALVLNKYKKESFETLTSIQEKSYRAIIRRRNSLIVAPTGSGKTESAIIPVISMISFENDHQDKNIGIKVSCTLPLNVHSITMFSEESLNMQNLRI